MVGGIFYFIALEIVAICTILPMALGKYCVKSRATVMDFEGYKYVF